jgi:hypothetical protein
VLYPIGACKPFVSPLGLSNLTFPLDSNIVVCKTSSLGICVLSSPDFMGIELPSDEAILEAMIMDHRPPPELEALQDSYQIIPWPKPSNGIYLEHYFA